MKIIFFIGRFMSVMLVLFGINNFIEVESVILESLIELI